MDATFTAAEREQMISLLERSRDEFLQIVDVLTPVQWDFRPDPGVWSPGLIAEHIVLAEGLLMGAAMRALRNPPDPDWAKKTADKLEFIERVMPKRIGRGAKAPDGVVPQGALGRQEVVDEFTRLRAHTIDFVSQLDQPVKAHLAEHPFPVFGVLNAHQWLIYIPLHTQRHIEQILELQSHPAFPVA